MVQSACKLLLPILCTTALGGGAAPAAAAQLTVGIGDNNPSMFSQSRFAAVHPQAARVIVFWNVATMRDTKYLRYARAWIADAQRAGVQPLVSFGGNGNYIPTVAQYTAAVKAFIRDFPSVKLYTAWNEPDWIYRSLSRNPKLAAQFFNALYQVCQRCTIAAGELYRPVNGGLAAWIKSYKSALRYKPKAWALHPYDDVRTHKTSQIQTLERYIGNTPIWLTEISGLLRRGHWPYPNQSAAAAGRDEQFLFGLPKRFHNISAIYHYQWQGTVPSPSTGWDSGLIAPNGTPRPAYNVVYNAAHGKLP
jgi:Glycosyl hydrolase catalytic core